MMHRQPNDTSFFTPSSSKLYLLACVLRVGFTETVCATYPVNLASQGDF